MSGSRIGGPEGQPLVTMTAYPSSGEPDLWQSRNEAIPPASGHGYGNGFGLGCGHAHGQGGQQAYGYGEGIGRGGGDGNGRGDGFGDPESIGLYQPR